jgi:hypothetical protein
MPPHRVADAHPKPGDPGVEEIVWVLCDCDDPAHGIPDDGEPEAAELEAAQTAFAGWH